VVYPGWESYTPEVYQGVIPVVRTVGLFPLPAPMVVIPPSCSPWWLFSPVVHIGGYSLLLCTSVCYSSCLLPWWGLFLLPAPMVGYSCPEGYSQVWVIPVPKVIPRCGKPPHYDRETRYREGLCTRVTVLNMRR